MANLSAEQPLVSIVTPVYNSLRFLPETAKSVQGQAYTAWEWLLIDDGSTDGSWAYLEELAKKDARIKCTRLEVNAGSGVARNVAIKQAAGKYIAFLDSDDLWTPDRLSVHVQFMQAQQAKMSHTSYGYVDETGAVVKQTFHVSKHPVTYKHLLKHTEISCLTAMYDAGAIGKFYMSEHRRKQDYALWLSILKTGVTSIPLDVELAYYRQWDGSATSGKAGLILKHFAFLRETQKLGVLASMYYTLHWMKNGVVKYYLP